MKFGVINLESMGFYNLYVHYVNLVISNFKTPCLEFELSHSICVFDPVNIYYYEKVQKNSSGAVQSIGRPLSDDGVKTQERNAKTERGPKPKRIRMNDGEKLTLEAGPML